MSDATTLSENPHAPEADEFMDEEYPRFLPSMIEHVRPRVLSRWVATIARFDHDISYRDIDRVYGIEQPAVVRMPSHVGPAYASSCVGVWISCYAQENGLRSGQVELVHPDGRSELLAPRVGFIEEAVATEHGITAVLAILSGQLHEDLGRLDERGQLASAQLCMLQKTRATRYVTDWGLSVYVVGYVRARLCQLTSLSHVAGNYIQRRLALDESLSEDDLQPTAVRWTPPAFGPDVVGERPMVAVINPGSVSTPKIATDAVTKDAFFEDDSSATVNFGTEKNLGAVTVETDGGHVKVHGKATLHTWGGTPSTVKLTLYKGTLSSPVAILDTTVEVAQAKHGVSLMGRDTSPASSQTYTLGADISSGGSGDSTVFLYRRVYAENTKATT